MTNDRSIFLRGIPYSATPDDVRAAFQKQIGRREFPLNERN
jgi:hypothetical protein